MQPTMTLIWQAMRQAGRLLLRQADILTDPNLFIEKREHMVNGAHQSVYQIIKQNLQASLPKYVVIAEGEPLPANTKDVWVIQGIDPLANYARALPNYAIPMLWYLDGELNGATLYDPNLDEFFSAVIGQGALLNQHRIRVAKRGRRLNESIVVSRFPIRKELVLQHLAGAQAIAPEVGSMTQSACASLSIAYVACGRYDAYWHVAQTGIVPNAALLIAKEAGANVTNWKGKNTLQTESELIVAAPACYPDLQKHLIRSK